MTDIAASMGIHQLKKANAFQQMRAQIVAWYDEAFGGAYPSCARPMRPQVTYTHGIYM